MPTREEVEERRQCDAIRAALESIHERIDDAHLIGQAAAMRDARYYGRNVWHVVIDEHDRLAARVALLHRLLLARCPHCARGVKLLPASGWHLVREEPRWQEQCRLTNEERAALAEGETSPQATPA